MASVVESVQIKASTGDITNCSSTCDKVFDQGTIVELTPKLKAVPNDYTRYAVAPWPSDCASPTDATCSVTMSAQKSIRVGASLIVSYTARYDDEQNSVLRNAVYFYDKGTLTTPGLPVECTHRTDHGCIDAVHIRNLPANRDQVCKALISGTVGTFAVEKPSSAGWVASFPMGYYNLKIADWTGAVWSRLCQNGKECFDRQYEYLTSLTCQKDL